MSESGNQRERYAAAGVDIAAGNEFVDAIKPIAGSTARPGATVDLGGFGGLFDLAACGYQDPLLVAATDGVGTKLMIAEATEHHHAVGIDLVAMCVNDLVVQGAEPLFFLDYMATGRLLPETARAVLEGIAEGCRQARCALIGGETAEMPGHYPNGRYDLAGFAVGAVERSKLLTGDNIAAGDRLLGLASSGLHSNGFSLVRKIIDDVRLDYGDPVPFETEPEASTLGAALMIPTRLYVRSLLAALPKGVRGLAHITGGGLSENLPRVLPNNCAAEIDMSAWPVPALFKWLKREGGISDDEIVKVFNCGIGMVVIVTPEDAESVTQVLREQGETVYAIGDVVPSEKNPERVTFNKAAGVWAA